MKRFLSLLVAVATLGFMACNDNDKLWESIEDLKSRVKALESQVDALNQTVASIQELYNGATISSVEEVNGNYVITLTNDKVLTLAQGSEAEAVMPIIGINDEGFWQVSYDGGKTYTTLGKAVAEDGATPTFRINDEGFWQVSYDGGKSYEFVKDTNDNPVSVIGNKALSDKFFEEVTVKEDILYIKLLDGSELSIPIVNNFYCRFVGFKGVQVFAPSEEKSFGVEIKGAESVLLTVPSGWKATLSELVTDNRAVLTVKAPDTITRAWADTSKDIAIEAISKEGFACVAKMQVECSESGEGGGEGEETPTPPTISAALSTTNGPTETSLTFDVTPSADADLWKYMLWEVSTNQLHPTATHEYIYEHGTLGTSLSVVCSNLKAGTKYEFYAVAFKNTVQPMLCSEVVKVEAETLSVQADQNDYYAVGVSVNGVTYDNTSEGATIVNVAADATANVGVSVGAGGVFFIDDQSNDYNAGVLKSAGVPKDAVIIGRYADQKAPFDMLAYLSLRNPQGTLAFKNLKIDATKITSKYLFNAVNGTDGTAVGGMKNFVFEDCEIAFSTAFITMYNAATSTGIENITFRNCKLRYVRNSDDADKTYAFITTQKITTGLSQFKSITFDNNIIYTSKAGLGISCSLFYQDNAAQQATLEGSTENLDIVFTNNTVADFISFGSGLGSAYFVVGKFKSILFENNLMYSSRSDKYPTMFRVSNNYGEAWPSIEMDRSKSRCYGTLGWKLFYTSATDFMPATITTNTIVKVSDAVFATCDNANGKFVKAEAYKTYGSTLE